ncbi:MAG: hypothetical protein M0P71_07360 [Melioribacteraceae bacterium]|jgi:hypothetical protein|nr:hypothetical protein [Melioribacteraceae bacterium]MDD3982828.1 hypothetical protein [Candidatus Omnitrophota bacterium]
MIKYKNTIRPTCPYCGYEIIEYKKISKYDFNEFAGLMEVCPDCDLKYFLEKNQQNHDNYDSTPFQIKGFCEDCKYFNFGDHNCCQLTGKHYLDEDYCSEFEKLEPEPE